MAANGDRMTWNHAADHDLLSCLVQHLQPNQDQLRGVVRMMHGLGYPCSLKAITQHLQKLRRKEGANSPKPAAAKKPAGVKKSAGTGTPRKRKGKAAPVMDDNADVDDDEEGDEFEGTPSKKAKTEPVIKDEDDE
ncbi:hypothetical protein B0T19DRAFT_431049 [Cercophora scortea]|uniref:Uncharacterized protein n=1 Tax=Cercophora scortea TaxID=314031 RepID=A0AAE0I9H0_9PEZI|nr:hypothetical protein B0T19DRAFT_431049 [Cercophora scortea]